MGVLKGKKVSRLPQKRNRKTTRKGFKKRNRKKKDFVKGNGGRKKDSKHPWTRWQSEEKILGDGEFGENLEYQKKGVGGKGRV